MCACHINDVVSGCGGGCSNAQNSKRSLARELSIAVPASVFLGLGTFFVVLNTGVYV
jgi:hypothetical protein